MFKVVLLSLPAQGMILTKPSHSGLRNRVEDFNPNFIEYYDYEEPLPQGPTRRPPQQEQDSTFIFPEGDEYDYYYQEEAPLPQGPTRELPLPSGPTRRPGQPTTLNPDQVKPLSPALSQFLNLPLLTTTERPRRPKLTQPQSQSKSVLKEFGPFESHFIAPPVVNAGALPLAVSNNLPLFPPFNKPTNTAEGDREN